MKTQTFDNREPLTRDTLSSLQQRNDTPAIIHLATQLTLIIVLLMIVLLAQPNTMWIVVPAAILLGLIQASLFAPMHECTHLSAFRSRRVNRVVAWVTGFAVLWTPSSYRAFHFEHHRHTHDPQRDPEISMGGELFANWPTRLHEYFALASGLLLLIMRLAMICLAALGLPDAWWKRFADYVRPQDRKRIVWESRLFILGYAAIIACGILWLPRIGFLLISLLVAHSFLAIYLAGEHTGCEVSGSIFQRTRTTISTAVVRFFMWNMPYHAEHHAYPNVPFHALPKLHHRVLGKLVHVDAGYAHLHRNVIRQICSGQPSRGA